MTAGKELAGADLGRWMPLVVPLCSSVSLLVSFVVPVPSEDEALAANFAKFLAFLTAGACVAWIADFHRQSKWERQHWFRSFLVALAAAFFIYGLYNWGLDTFISPCGTRPPLNQKKMIIGWSLTPLGEEAKKNAGASLRIEDPTPSQIIEGAYAYRENIWPKWQRQVRWASLHLLYILVPVSFVIVLFCLVLSLPIGVTRELADKLSSISTKPSQKGDD
jgi:amino acid transporter